MDFKLHKVKQMSYNELQKSVINVISAIISLISSIQLGT